MRNIQETMEQGARAELLEAQVEASETRLTLRIGASLIPAIVAPSCLLRPESGDRVLVSQSRCGTAVIAVLERGEGEALLKVGEGVAVRFSGHAIELEGKRVAVCASKFRVDADRATIRARSLALVADAMTTAAGAVRAVADRVDVVAARMTEYVGRSLRRVEREHVEAGDLTARCTGIHETSGEHVVVVGRRVTKIDGGQVQIG